VPDARILVLGYGNPGRRDDGLGPAAAEAIEALSLRGVRTSANYQLMIEDAYDVAESDVVIFIDASKSGTEPYSIWPVQPATNLSAFASHVVAPELVLGLSGSVYGHVPRASLIGIRGYAFDFEEGLSARAQANLSSALVHIRNVMIGRRKVIESSESGAPR
jgi:hydrogenase maturation protease